MKEAAKSLVKRYSIFLQSAVATRMLPAAIVGSEAFLKPHLPRRLAMIDSLCLTGSIGWGKLFRLKATLVMQ